METTDIMFSVLILMLVITALETRDPEVTYWTVASTLPKF